jgi:hypothetical protein
MIAKELLQPKADAMNAYLQERSGNEPNDLIERLENLSVLVSQAGEYLAAAKYYHDVLIHSELMKCIKEGYMDKLTATALNKLVNALAKEESYLVNQFDRINSSAVHQIDGLRSILSYRKTEFSTLNYTK